MIESKNEMFEEYILDWEIRDLGKNGDGRGPTANNGGGGGGGGGGETEFYWGGDLWLCFTHANPHPNILAGTSAIGKAEQWILEGGERPTISVQNQKWLVRSQLVSTQERVSGGGVMVAVKKSATNKFFENQYNLKELLTLSVAVTLINKGYVKKDAMINEDEDGVETKLPNLFIINNKLGIEKFKTKRIDKTPKVLSQMSTKTREC